MSGGERMAAEMAEQPAVLRGLLTRRPRIADELAHQLPDPLRGVVLVARGSSDNAAVHGRYVIEHSARVPVVLAAPSLQTRYDVTPRLDGFLVVGISQSGATPEIVETVERLAAGGARTVAVTNAAGSPLDEVADATILLEAGDEEAVPATKTFTAQMAAMALLAETLADAAPWDAADWERAVGAVEEVLDSAETVGTLAGRLADTDHVVLVGRGFLYAVALEAGLKIAETTGLTVHGTSPADLRHGPIATAGPGMEAICFAAPGPTAGDVAEVAHELVDRGVRVAAVAPDGPEGGLVPAADHLVPVPGGVAEQLAPLPQVVRAQQLALATARMRGIDADAPFALQKVTRTT